MADVPATGAGETGTHLRRCLAGVLAAASLLVSASCSADPAPGSAETPGAGTSAPAAAAPSGPADATPATPAGTDPTPAQGPDAPAGNCLSGTYRLERFLGLGESQTYGTGVGGDVRLTFTDRGYTLTGGGKDPIRLTLAGGTGDLTVAGTVQGTYTGRSPQNDFTVEKSEGKATLEVGGDSQTLTMADVAQVIAPDGQATVACNPPKMVLLLPSIRLELSRS